MAKFKVGLLQITVVNDKDENLQKAEIMMKKAVKRGADIIILPEMFNCPYDIKYFPDYAEQRGGKTWEFLSSLAEKNDIFLIGGSIPELDEEGNINNTSFVFDNRGNEIACHRKMHLFDVDIKGGQSFKESEILSPGREITCFSTPFTKIGLAICYDFRFPELARLMVKKGAELIIIPAAFNMTTGPAHWEILFRTRAVDNQVYTLGAAPARNEESSYRSYGNSIIADPWGRIRGRLGAEEEILIKELDTDLVEKTRRELPLLQHIRDDIYKLK